MIIIQFTGLSGAGKSTIAYEVEKKLSEKKYPVEIIDGDEYRLHLCKDLGFSEKDRKENIRRLGFVAKKMARHNIIVLLSAINPYESTRYELKTAYQHVKTVWVKCRIDVLIKRDTKGLYKRALADEKSPDKIFNLSGINDTYEEPAHPDLVVNTDQETVDVSVEKVLAFILANLPVKK